LVLANVTSSLPVGLYRLSLGAPVIGDIVAVRPPAAARAYLQTLGYPPDALLLKRLAAVGGARVCAFDRERMSVDGRLIRRRTRDRLGRSLPAWRGCRVLGPSEALLLGEGEASFDSRYFGPAPMEAIVGVYERLP